MQEDLETNIKGELLTHEHEKKERLDDVEYTDIYGLLSPKHALFVDYYLKYGMNGARAYREVYPNVKDTSAESSASRLLKEPDILEAILKLSNYLNKNKRNKDFVDSLQDLTLLTRDPDDKIRVPAIFKLIDINFKLFQLQVQMEKDLQEKAEREGKITGDIILQPLPATEFLKLQEQKEKPTSKR